MHVYTNAYTNIQSNTLSLLISRCLLIFIIIYIDYLNGITKFTLIFFALVTSAFISLHKQNRNQTMPNMCIPYQYLFLLSNNLVILNVVTFILINYFVMSAIFYYCFGSNSSFGKGFEKKNNNKNKRKKQKT